MILKVISTNYEKANELEKYLDVAFQCMPKKQEKTGIKNITY